MTARNITTLVAGLVFVVVGSLFLAANLTDFAVNWFVVLKTALPLLFVLGGALKLVRHYSWDLERNRLNPAKASLFAGIFLACLGVALLLDVLGVLESFEFIGFYWPVLLILFGIGKIVDYYRFQGRLTLRAGEVFGVIFVIAFGLAAGRLSKIHWPLWDEVTKVGFSLPLPDELTTPEFRFEEQSTLETGAATSVRVSNLYGNTEVLAGEAGRVAASLAEVVHAETQTEAQSVADQVRILSRMEGTILFIGTNRDAIGEKGKHLQTHLKVLVPPGLPLQVESGYGATTVRGIQAGCKIANSYGVVNLEDIEGNVQAETKYRKLTVRNVRGDVTATNRRAEIQVERVTGSVSAQTDYDRLVVKEVDGAVSAGNHFGSIELRAIRGAATVEGAGSKVTIEGLENGLVVKNSHKDLEIRRVNGPTTIESSYSRIDLSQLSGPVGAKVSHSNCDAKKISGGIRLQGLSSELRLSEISGAIDVVTSLKKVSIKGFSGGPVSVQNEYAEIEIESRESPRDSIKASNRNGEISIQLPAKGNFRISAQAVSGQIESDFGALPKPSSDGAVAVLEATVGQPGPTVELQTSNSRISIRKRG